MSIEHILVTTDLSPEALRPCAPVGSLARVLGARVTLLHVVEDLLAIPHGAPLAPSLSAPDLQRRTREARAQLEGQRDAFGEDVALTLDLISGGDIPAAITEYAKAHDVDLVALSTHGRTGFRHLALGSVAEAVVRHAEVPVIVFPQPKD